MQKEHKDDKQRLQQEMSAYYREHGINPLASVGPLLLQIPIFISLYMLLRQDAAERPVRRRRFPLHPRPDRQADGPGAGRDARDLRLLAARLDRDLDPDDAELAPRRSQWGCRCCSRP